MFVLEVMGRNAGWLAAGCGLAADRHDAAPHVVLLPEVAFDEAKVLAAVKGCVERLGFCAIAVAEGIRGPDGRPLAQVATDSAGYVQLGGAGAVVAARISASLGYKVHHAIGDYLQRAARHLASATDDAQAHAVGVFAVEAALSGESGFAPLSAGRPHVPIAGMSIPCRSSALRISRERCRGSSCARTGCM